MTLGKLKRALTKANLEHRMELVEELRRQIFLKIFERKSKGKTFKAKHIA